MISFGRLLGCDQFADLALAREAAVAEVLSHVELAVLAGVLHAVGPVLFAPDVLQDVGFGLSVAARGSPVSLRHGIFEVVVELVSDLLSGRIKISDRLRNLKLVLLR